MKKILAYIRMYRLAIKWMFRINLGDLIVYKGEQYTVCNGVRPHSWRIEYKNNDDGWVPRCDCRKVWTIENMIGSFHSGLNFYRTSWLDIWKRDGVEEWQKSCNIW